MEGPTAWSKLPVDLQHQFFTHAAEESQRCKRRLLEQATKLRAFRKLLPFEEICEDDSWKNWRIASVDGSYSPATSERMGARYGVCCAGYLIFEADQLVDEGYTSGEICQEQVGDPEVTSQILSLLSTKLEREAAMHCLRDEKVDLLLIDGAFFGFRSFQLSNIRNRPIEVDGFEKVGTLVDHIRDLSIDIMNSGKAVGVVKRVRTNAFDGWLIEKDHDKHACLERNDRVILASIMPERSWFAYEWLFGSPTNYNFYNTLRTIYEKSGKDDDLSLLLENAKRQVELDVKRSLNCSADKVLKTSRNYVRCCDSAAPFCFEILAGTDVKPILSYFRANHNAATGLPFPMDLIDQNVSLPTEFTKEFVEEVEALLIHDAEIEKFDLSNYFQSINPQKEE